jgi:hypothetical protein
MSLSSMQKLFLRVLAEQEGRAPTVLSLVYVQAGCGAKSWDELGVWAFLSCVDTYFQIPLLTFIGFSSLQHRGP